MSAQPEALRLARALIERHGVESFQGDAAAELRRLHASCEDYAQHKQRQDQRVLELAERVLELKAQRDALLEALKGMEARFGCESSRSETKPKTYGCRHMAETCGNCYGLVTGWMAVQAARAAIKAVEEGENHAKDL